MGRGDTLMISYIPRIQYLLGQRAYVGWGHFFFFWGGGGGVQHFEFQYFLGFSENEYFLGYDELWIFFLGGHHKIGLY